MKTDFFKGTFYKNMLYCCGLNSLINLKTYIKVDNCSRNIENKHPFNIDICQAWKMANSSKQFSSIIDNSNFIDNNPLTSSLLAQHGYITIFASDLIKKENCSYFYSDSDQGGVLLTNKNNSILISNGYGDGRTSIYICEMNEDKKRPICKHDALKETASGLFKMSDTISGIWNIKAYDCDRNSKTLYTLKGLYFVYYYNKTVVFERIKTLEELQKK